VPSSPFAEVNRVFIISNRPFTKQRANGRNDKAEVGRRLCVSFENEEFCLHDAKHENKKRLLKEFKDNRENDQRVAT